MKSGEYKYFLNGEPTGVVETFSIKEMPDGSIFTTSTRNATSFGTTIRAWTTEKEGRYKTCNIEFRKDSNLIEAGYAFNSSGFRVSRKINGNTIQDKKIETPGNAIFFPLMRCYQGQTILYVSRFGYVSVIVPDIQNPAEAENLLRPTYDKRKASLISEKEGVRIFKYVSKHYNENSEFHLNENGLLVYYKFAQNENQLWEVRLESKD